MVKVTLEFQNVEETIVALGKLGGIVAAPAEKAPRKGRNDAGKPRGEYKPRAQDGAPATATATNAETKGSTTPASNGLTGVTESGSAKSAGPSTVPAAAGPAASAAATADAAQVGSTTAGAPSNPADVVKAEIQAQQKTQGTGFEPTIGEKDAEVQAAVQAIYGKVGIDPVKKLLADFGIGLLRNLPKSKKADFLAAAGKLVA
jgi:hypothetical protein